MRPLFAAPGYLDAGRTLPQTRTEHGVAPEQIAVDLRNALDSIQYRWNTTQDWTPRELGIAAHAELVRIHPFTDGNGRTTRLLADLVTWYLLPHKMMKHFMDMIGI